MGGDDAAELSRLLEAELAGQPPHQGPRGYLGVALYRSARYDEALQSLDDSLAPESMWQTDAMLWPMLAMTHWKLGQPEEARKWLDRSSWWTDLARRAADVPHAVGLHSINYYEWLCAQVFHQEAKELIDGPDAAGAHPTE